MKNWISKHAALLLLIAFCMALGVFLSLRTGSFFSLKNLVNILEANSYRMLLAVGMMCVITSGAIDLSSGSILSFSAICMAVELRAGWPVGLCALLALLMGALLGAANGLLIHATQINPLIITLSTSFMYRGLSLIVTRGTPVTKLPTAFRALGCGDILGMESGVTAAAVVVLVMIPLFYKMRWGTYIASLGGNPEALRRCGVPTGRYRVSVFALSGFLAAMAGIIITARLNSAEPNAGLNMEMDAICAVIMGGTALHGGSGSLPGTVVAVFLQGMIRNGLTVLSVSSYYQQFLTGAMLLCAVVAAEFRSRRSRMG